ncbi:tripartite tricarboxylate transporter permease [Natrinema versiforme]|nr:tripartite tricarboxylate transporter permease [Natrinema versiforme]
MGLLSIIPVDLLKEAGTFIFGPENLALILLITIIGIILGAIPGVGQTLALALFFPFTLTMGSERALMLLAVLYGATTYGGAISAILIRVPGSSTSMASILDGYPMTQNGESARAIGISTVASFIGAIVGLIVLMLVSPSLARFAATLASHEIFWLTVIGFATVSSIVQGSIMKSIVGLSLGVVFATVGPDPILAVPRFTFDTYYLQGGINLIVLFVGIFSIPQAIDLVNQSAISDESEMSGQLRTGISEVLSKPIKTLRGGLIGTLVGAVPGVGGTAANFLSYLTAMKTSKNSDKFGEGAPEGLIASESANNGAAMGTLVPAISLAIPGSATAAIFIGAMIAHGITPGIQAFEGSLPYIIYMSIFLGAVLFLVLGLFGGPYFAKVAKLPNDAMIVGIIVFSLAGSFAVRNNFLDIMLAISIGFIGYLMMENGYSVVTFVIGYVLSPISEGAILRALRSSGGDFTVLWSTPTSIILIILSVVILLAPFISKIILVGKGLITGEK